MSLVARRFQFNIVVICCFVYTFFTSAINLEILDFESQILIGKIKIPFFIGEISKQIKYSS